MNRTFYNLLPPAARLRLVATLGVLLFTPIPVRAEEPDEPDQEDTRVLTLKECRDLALEQNKKLQAARHSTERYGYLVKSYRANYFPNFKLLANDLYTNTKGSVSIAGGYLPTFSLNAATGSLLPNVVTDAAGNPVVGADGTPLFSEYAYFPDQDIDYKVGNIFQAGVTVEQPIYMGGKITAAYRMAKVARRMAEQNEALTSEEVIVETEQAYMLVVKTDELSKVAQRYNAMLQELYTNVENACKHGLSSRNDLLKVSVKLSESELKLSQAANAQRLAQMNLCHVVGLPLSQPVAVVAGDMLIAPTAPTADAGVTTRPEYEILSQQEALAAQQTRLDRSDFLPQLALAGSYSYVHGFELADQTLFTKPGYGVLLTLSVPLYHFGEGINKVRAARREQERIAAERADLVEQMNLELAQAGQSLEEAFLEVSLAERVLAEAEDNLRTSGREYEVGLETLVNYMEAQTLWQQAVASKVEAQCKLFVAGTRYRKASGQLR